MKATVQNFRMRSQACARTLLARLFLITCLLSVFARTAAAQTSSCPYDPEFLIVTGASTPDASGIYAPIGIYDKTTEYARQSDSAFFIWRRSGGFWSSQWVLSDVAPTNAWNLSPYWNFNYHIIPIGNSSVASANATGTITIAVYDPNNTTGVPVVLPIPVPLPTPSYPSRIEITGANLAPDATGYYALASNTYNSLPVWTREGDGAFSIWAVNSSIWRLSVAPGNTSAGMWKWDYQNPGKYDTTGSTTYTGVASSEYADPDFPTPGRYLAGRSHPVYKSGHTLPPLTKFSWPYSYELTKEMARWGYALDFGDALSNSVANINKPSTREAKIIALVRNDPTNYTLCVNLSRYFEDNAPDAAYCHDSSNNLISPKTFSPQASNDVVSAIATSTIRYLQQVVSQAPAAVILNGGERGMGVYGNVGTQWKLDPTVMSAKGALSWSDYQSQRKLHEESYFANGAHSVAHALYIYYTCGGNAGKNLVFYGNWWQWDWDYKYFHTISDLPSNESYFKSGNSGWVSPPDGATHGEDALTKALDGIGNAISYGKPLSYNWLCAGWSTNATSSYNSDMGLYYGFLKSCYTAGMIGGNAGYYTFPYGGFDAMFDKDAPPHWLQQIEALGQVHAEFSYLEDMLRHGDLLPGPMKHRWTEEQPAYEYWTGFYNTRVLARKLRGHKRWLVSAWASDAIPRTVSVTIPVLGSIALIAQPAGSLYDVRIVEGVRSFTQIDNGSMTPTPLILPTGTPDADAFVITFW